MTETEAYDLEVRHFDSAGGRMWVEIKVPKEVSLCRGQEQIEALLAQDALCMAHRLAEARGVSPDTVVPVPPSAFARRAAFPESPRG